MYKSLNTVKEKEEKFNSKILTHVVEKISGNRNKKECSMDGKWVKK